MQCVRFDSVAQLKIRAYTNVTARNDYGLHVVSGRCWITV